MLEEGSFEADNRVKPYLAHSFNDAGRIADSLYILRSMLANDSPLTPNDRKLILSVWKNTINAHRSAVLNLSDESSLVPAYNVLSEKLLHLIHEAQSIIEQRLLPDITDMEERMNVQKALCDFKRYELECTPKKEHESIANTAFQMYSQLLSDLNSSASPPILVLLSTTLNHGILLADNLGRRNEALEEVEKLKRDTALMIEKFPDELHSRITETLQLMESNITRWKAEAA